MTRSVPLSVVPATRPVPVPAAVMLMTGVPPAVFWVRVMLPSG
jgi:hypothetical protein